MSFFGVPLRNGLPIGLGSSAGFGVPAFNPQQLFSNGEQGVWYDPSDFSTMFQDVAGTTPVTAVEQTVGLILDKSKGLSIGTELRANGVVGLVGSATAATYNTSTGVGSASRVDLSNQSYVEWSGLNSQSFYIITVQNTSASTLIIRQGSAGSIQATINANTTSTVYVIPSGAGLLTFAANTNGTTVTFTLSSIKIVFGNPAYQTTAGSRPTLKQTAEGLFYLNFDGNNDSLITNSINFTSTNKMTVWAGLLKSSDAAQGIVTELSATIASNNGAFLLSAPNSAAANYNWSSKGTTQVDNTVTTYAAPNIAVLTGQADIAAPSNTIRVNGIQAGNVSTSQGTGNFGNYQLYIGRRNNATLPFNGRLYSLIVRGAASTAVQVSNTEYWVADRTGISL